MTKRKVLVGAVMLVFIASVIAVAQTRLRSRGSTVEILSTSEISLTPFANSGVNVVATHSGGAGVYKYGFKATDTLAAGFGSSTFLDPSSAFGIKGIISGANLTKSFNTIGGVTGVYNITGTNASQFPKAGVVGIVGDTTTTADAAVMGYLDGDGGQTNARAAFAVMMQNSTGASGFDFGFDAKPQLVTGHETYSQPYKKADVNLSADVWILSGTATTRAAAQAAAPSATPVGSIFVGVGAGATTKPHLYVKMTSNTWERIVTAAVD